MLFCFYISYFGDVNHRIMFANSHHGVAIAVIVAEFVIKGLKFLTLLKLDCYLKERHQNIVALLLQKS